MIGRSQRISLNRHSECRTILPSDFYDTLPNVRSGGLCSWRGLSRKSAEKYAKRPTKSTMTRSKARAAPLLDFPLTSSALEAFGLKFSPGGAHISRTIMLHELDAVLTSVPRGSGAAEYREAILQRNVLGKATNSTREKSLRHLRELYALDEATPIFGLLRKLHEMDAASLPLLALQAAWGRDPLLRATTQPVMDASEGEQVKTASLAMALEAAFPNQYSELNRDKIARNAASSWAQSEHLVGRAKKIRQGIKPTAVAVTMAFFLGDIAGYHGAAVFSNPWCRLLDLKPDRAKAVGFETHRAGLLNFRAVGEVIELSFPLLLNFKSALHEHY